MTHPRALHIYAGPRAMRHLQQEGLSAHDIQVIAGAAGGPKGLILGPLDQYLFGHWLTQSSQPVDLVGASIGAWRMATACLDHPAQAFERLSHDYIHQHYAIPEGQKRPSRQQVSASFARNLEAFYGGRVQQLLNHPRYRLHIMTSRGRHLLAQEHPLKTPLGYAGAYLSNALHRRALGWWLDRVVFSNTRHLPFDSSDYPTQQVPLHAGNFMDALMASCSIPFALQAVPRIQDAPDGAYWDGGITDYHLHLNYKGLVLYPHFQQTLVPGWLDKALKWRHPASAFLDNVIVLAPNPEWVKTLPNGKLPDRSDFLRYGNDLDARVKVWSQAVKASHQWVDEFHDWLQNPSDTVKPL
jgi:hypothetical protein